MSLFYRHNSNYPPPLHPLCISTVSHKWRSDGPEESKSSIFLDLLQRAVEEGKAIKLPSSDWEKKCIKKNENLEFFVFLQVEKTQIITQTNGWITLDMIYF